MINRIFLIITTDIVSGAGLCPAADSELGSEETVTADVMAYLMMLK